MPASSQEEPTTPGWLPALKGEYLRFVQVDGPSVLLGYHIPSIQSIMGPGLGNYSHVFQVICDRSRTLRRTLHVVDVLLSELSTKRRNLVLHVCDLIVILLLHAGHT